VQNLPPSMTSLPRQTGPRPQQTKAYEFLRAVEDIGCPEREDERSLVEAFRSFTAVSSSLEHSYRQLQEDVETLRCELQAKNGDLEYSLNENRSMREHLDHILQSLPCGVLVVTKDERITKLNHGVIDLLGLESLRDGDRCNFPSEVRDLLTSARSEKQAEIRISAGDGRTRWVAARHAPLGNSDSVFILWDVSVQKCLEETQAQLRREQLLAEISALLAHEIRNPLGSMELFAGLLADSSLNPECRQWVEHLQAGLRTLAATVNNVLSLHSSSQLELVPVDLGALLESTREFLMPLARQNNVVLSLQNGLSGVCLAADPHRLQQVLLNLIVNSVRAMPGGGWIECAGRVVQQAKAAEVVVCDTGPGVAAEHLQRIFEPGFSTRQGSPGLGLAVCRKIVEQHGGTITADSRPGHGARFAMTFPLRGWNESEKEK
jgi:two-component system sensor histidine kinase FlrB